MVEPKGLGLRQVGPRRIANPCLGWLLHPALEFLISLLFSVQEWEAAVKAGQLTPIGGGGKKKEKGRGGREERGGRGRGKLAGARRTSRSKVGG